MSLRHVLAKVVPTMQITMRAFPREGQTVEQLAEKLRELGNPIVRIEEDHVVCIAIDETTDQWGCMVCLNEDGHITLLDNEKELRDHLDVAHQGWIIDERGNPIVIEDET